MKIETIEKDSLLDYLTDEIWEDMEKMSIEDLKMIVIESLTKKQILAWKIVYKQKDYLKMLKEKATRFMSIEELRNYATYEFPMETLKDLNFKT